MCVPEATSVHDQAGSGRSDRQLKSFDLKAERLFSVSNALRLADAVWEPRVHLLGYFLQEVLADLKRRRAGMITCHCTRGQQESVAPPRTSLSDNYHVWTSGVALLCGVMRVCDQVCPG